MDINRQGEGGEMKEHKEVEMKECKCEDKNTDYHLKNCCNPKKPIPKTSNRICPIMSNDNEKIYCLEELCMAGDYGHKGFYCKLMGKF